MPSVPRHPRHALLDAVQHQTASDQSIQRRQHGVTDAAGNLRVGVGALGAFDPTMAGDYGVLIGDPQGHHQALYPPASTIQITNPTFTNSGWTALLATPFKVWVGTSGKALVTCTVDLQVPAVNTARINVNVNGVEVSGVAPGGIATGRTMSAQNWPNGTTEFTLCSCIPADTTTGIVASSLNTFQVHGLMDGAGTATVYYVALVIQPL